MSLFRRFRGKTNRIEPELQALANQELARMEEHRKEQIQQNLEKRNKQIKDVLIKCLDKEIQSNKLIKQQGDALNRCLDKEIQSNKLIKEQGEIIAELKEELEEEEQSNQRVLDAFIKLRDERQPERKKVLSDQIETQMLALRNENLRQLKVIQKLQEKNSRLRGQRRHR